MPKNVAKAREWLEEYLSRLAEYEAQPSDDYTKTGPQAVELHAWLQRNQDRVKVVVEELVPDEVWILAGSQMA